MSKKYTENELINEKLLEFEANLPILKKHLNALITFSEKNRKFKAGAETLKEKMIISFEVSCANHLMAMRDLLFYPTFPELGNFEKVIYQPTPLNYHAITISVISRAMLELTAILYWMLKGDEQTTSIKLAEYLVYLNFAAAVNAMNAPIFDGQRPPLNDKQREAIKIGKDYRTNEACQKCWKDLTPNDVRGDFYVVINRKLKVEGEKGLSSIVANFLDIEIEQTGKNKEHFRDLYRLLSDIAHSNPYAIASLFSMDRVGPGEITINFRNGDPQILNYTLMTAVACYGYVLEVLLKTFNNEGARAELLGLIQIYHNDINKVK